MKTTNIKARLEINVFNRSENRCHFIVGFISLLKPLLQRILSYIWTGVLAISESVNVMIPLSVS